MLGIGDIVAPTVVDRTKVTDAPVGQIIYDLTGAGFYALNPSGVWNQLVSASGGPRSEVWVYTNNGDGTTNTKIRKWVTTGKKRRILDNLHPRCWQWPR